MKIELYNSDNLEIMAKMPDESVDVICIDPPYLYLKNQKLERKFDEQLFFSECKRLLTKDGFIILFGRGESFYRWNTILADLGFNFKEEIVWDKNYNSSAVHPLSRVHETISIFSKENGVLNKMKIPYLESKKHEIDKIVGDIKRLRCVLSKSDELKNVQTYLECKTVPIIGGEKGATTTHQKGVYKKSVTASVMQMIEVGMNEKSIIRIEHERYSRIHPTQKPVRLLERLLKLVIPMKKDKIVITDWFAGSFSTCEAVINLQAEFPEKEFEFIGTEIDEEYFESGKNRINNKKICTP